MARVKFEDALGDLLGSVASAMRAGIGFEQALLVAGESAPSLLRKEVEAVAADLNAGQSRTASMRGVLARHPSDNMEFLVAAVELNESAGGDISATLDTIASTIRERAALKRDVRVMTAQIRLSGYLLAAIPLALVVVVSQVAPDYYAPVWSSPVGVGMLGGAAVLSILGLLIMRLLARVRW